MLADYCLYENVAWCFTHLAAIPTVEFSLFLNSIDVIGQAMSPMLFSPKILQLPHIFLNEHYKAVTKVLLSFPFLIVHFD